VVKAGILMHWLLCRRRGKICGEARHPVQGTAIRRCSIGRPTHPALRMSGGDFGPCSGRATSSIRDPETPAINRVPL
jgi:hypothetical protein